LVVSDNFIATPSRSTLAPGTIVFDNMIVHKVVRTKVLEIAYEESGALDGVPVLLMHGWPYDPRVYDDVVPILTAAKCRTIVPHLRGFGPTRFLSPDTLRSGQQAALGNDLKEFMDALGIKSATLAGYDWGGRAACIVAALWPDRVQGLVTGDGYNIQDIPNANKPAAPDQELRYWYQHYFNTERGRAGLAANRRELIRLLWRLWSPLWHFDDRVFNRSAACWDNLDFVDVTISSYRHRYGNAPGDPALQSIEEKLAVRPPIRVPTIVLHGEANGLLSDMWSEHERHFTGRHERRLIAGVGHNLPAEAPEQVATAVLELVGRRGAYGPLGPTGPSTSGC
jgi:pimeloyl-ACP methyl ester carboxylesterase